MSPFADEDHHLMAFVRKMKLFTDVACSAQLDRTHARNAKQGDSEEPPCFAFSR